MSRDTQIPAASSVARATEVNSTATSNVTQRAPDVRRKFRPGAGPKCRCPPR